MRIGLVSDTHIPAKARALPPELFNGLAGSDLIIHAGDLTDMCVLEELSLLAPVVAVYGNVDPVEIRRLLPYSRIVEVEGRRIGVVHGAGAGGTTAERALRAFTGVDCVVYGHSHRPDCTWRNGVLCVNPGSPTDRRLSPHFSYGILTVTSAGMTPEIIYFGP